MDTDDWANDWLSESDSDESEVHGSDRKDTLTNIGEIFDNMRCVHYYTLEKYDKIYAKI